LMLSLPPHFIRNVTEAFPNEGAAWLVALPDSLADVATQWSLTLGDAVPNLSFNYVCFATRADGTPAILKVCVPNREVKQEIDALNFCNGRFAARLLESDADRGWLLLERIFPGTPLSAIVETDDDAATRILGQMMQELCVPLPATHPFLPLTEWAKVFNALRQRFDGKTGPFPESLIARAEATFALPVALPVLLHGDFHHDNVIKKALDDDLLGHHQGLNQWVMIDSKGMAGDRLADVGPILYNPLEYIDHHPNLYAVTDRRIAILSEVLNAERDLIIEWGLAMTMLSAVWSLDDSTEGWRMTLRLAETLSELKG
jgi:streptomycin 6-kinase